MERGTFGSLFCEPRKSHTWLFLSGALLFLASCSQPKIRKVVETNSRHREETFVQAASYSSYTKVDVILVMDNSGSMSEEQAQVVNNFNSFLTAIDYLEWRVAVVTSDYIQGDSNGSYQRWRGVIDKGQLTPAQQQSQFQTMISVGVSGSGNERPIASALRVLKKNPMVSATENFLRTDAFLAVVVVSDEDECSTGVPSTLGASSWTADFTMNNCASNADSPQAFINEANTIKGVGQYSVYGIFWAPGSAAVYPGANSAYEAATTYSLVQQTAGTWASIWSTDYNSILSQLGSSIAAPLNRSFELSEVPIAGSVEVLVNHGMISSSSFSVNHTVVTLHSAPPAGASITIRYQVELKP